jgi:hypothetical protein
MLQNETKGTESYTLGQDYSLDLNTSCETMIA